jgi:putative inorganic carbon (hco3(-)) transporter
VSLRELLLYAVVGLASVAGLAEPRYALYGYLWYAVLRPDVLAWVQNATPSSLILAAVASAGWFRDLIYVGRLFVNPISFWLVVLQVPLALSYAFALVVTISTARYVQFIEMIAIVLLIPVLIRTEQHLKTVLLILALSIGFLGFKFGLYGLANGGVYLGGYGDMDNNLIALAIAMGMPLCWFSRNLTHWKPLRLVLGVMALASCAAVPMTNSRGGSLALGVGLLLILRHSKRKIGVGVAVLCVLGMAIYLVQDVYIKRMATLENYEDDASAYSRIVHVKTAVRMWQDYPIFGVGFGGLNYAELAGRYSSDFGSLGNHVVHNTYFEVLVDSGIFAFLIYVPLMFGTVWWLGRSIKRWRDEPERADIVRTIQGPLAVFLLGANFYSMNRYDLPYILLMCASVWYLLEKKLLEDKKIAARQPQVAAAGRRTLVIDRPAASHAHR